MPSLAFAASAAFVLAAMLALVLGLSERLKVMLLLLLGVSLRLFVATRSPLILQYWPMTDDSHYYFLIARNLVQGHGLMHDSFNSTTGFQPLFLFLIAPIFKLIPDKLHAINAVLIFQSIVGALGGMLLCSLARLITSTGIGLFALAVWATSPIFLIVNLNGLETNTALFMLLATLYFYFRHFRQSDPPDSWDYVRLGLLCGVSFLARIDLGILIPILCVDILLRDPNRASMRAKLPRLALLGLAAALPMLPWLLYNLVVAGSVLPSSGQAIRFLSVAYGFHVLQAGPEAANRYFEISQIPGDYYWLMIRSGATEVEKILQGTFPLWAGATIVAVSIFLSCRQVLTEFRKVAFFLAFLAALFFSYTCYIFGYWFFDRYFVPFALGYLLILFTCLAQLSRKLRSGHMRLLRIACVVFFPVVLGSQLLITLRQVDRTLDENSPAKFYQVAEWLNANTPPDAVVGAFQTGITGYYLERRFYALDGKVNIDALHAMQSKRIDRYVQEKGIDYLADWPWILNDLFTRRSEDPGFLSRQKLIWQGPADVYELDNPDGRKPH
jgi:Dolichyl-phosphate-mannose-protein mannosyltransferase